MKTGRFLYYCFFVIPVGVLITLGVLGTLLFFLALISVL